MGRFVTGDFFLPYDPNLKEAAREMRKHPTPTEDILWRSCLKTLEPQFLRQRPIQNFIVDFYCPNLKLVIEIDGGQHQTQEGLIRDSERTEILKSHGLEVLRFNNDQIINDLDNVISIIKAKLN